MKLRRKSVIATLIGAVLVLVFTAGIAIAAPNERGAGAGTCAGAQDRVRLQEWVSDGSCSASGSEVGNGPAYGGGNGGGTQANDGSGRGRTAANGTTSQVKEQSQTCDGTCIGNGTGVCDGSGRR